MSETVVKKGPRRADAQHNYDAFWSTARSAVAERGGDIVLEDIARNAGVGIGTLYRHFPTRQALLEAAFLDEALELRQRADDLQSAPAPLDALIQWLRLQMDFGAHGRSMGAAVMNAKHTEGTEIQIACVDMRDGGRRAPAPRARSGRGPFRRGDRRPVAIDARHRHRQRTGTRSVTRQSDVRRRDRGNTNLT